MEDVTLRFDYEYYDTLDEMRRDGEHNMYEAHMVLQDAYPDITVKMALDIVSDWMDTFDSRWKQGVTGD